MGIQEVSIFTAAAAAVFVVVVVVCLLLEVFTAYLPSLLWFVSAAAAAGEKVMGAHGASKGCQRRRLVHPKKRKD